MEKETCFWCGKEVKWVNSLGYCRECMELLIAQHHKEAKNDKGSHS